MTRNVCMFVNSLLLLYCLCLLGNVNGVDTMVVSSTTATSTESPGVIKVTGHGAPTPRPLTSQHNSPTSGGPANNTLVSVNT